MFTTSCPRCGEPTPDFEDPIEQYNWCLLHNLDGFGEARPIIEDDDNAPF